MHTSLLDSYGKLRIVVGYLGEKSHSNWWSTSFFDKFSQTFLEPVFPRTLHLSKYNGVRQAACCLHDKFIGVGNAFHLFRLPEEVEQDLQQLVLSAPEEWFNVISNRDIAMNTLLELAGECIQVEEGPKAVGELSDLYHQRGFKKLAQNYLGAFEQQVCCFPYFRNSR
jgi:hypothetical protein